MSGISYVRSDYNLDIRKKVSFLNRYNIFKINFLKDRNHLFIHHHLNVFNQEIQPIEQKGVFLILDGKIFNDDVYEPNSEYCLKKYLNQGLEFIKELNGEFFIAIYDTRTNDIFFFTDRYNTRTHFLLANKDEIIISPDYEFILQFTRSKISFNTSAMHEFISNGYTKNLQTFINEISIIPPCTILTISNGLPSFNKYWKYSYKEPDIFDENELVQKLTSTFLKSIQRRLKYNYKYIVELSGGLDSRSILAGITSVFGSTKTRSITFGSKNCDETVIARSVANLLGIEHFTMDITPEMIINNSIQTNDISGGLSYIGVSYNIPISKHLSTLGNVMIDGFALDLMLGGNYLILGTKSDEKIFNTKVMFNQVGDIPVRTYIETLHPTIDNDFIDVILSIPQNNRYKHRIYKKFLKSIDPYMVTIPYNKTMIPVYFPEKLWDYSSKYIMLKELAKNKIRNITDGKITLKDNRSYVSFHEWFYTNQHWRSFFSDLLQSKTTEILDQDLVSNIRRNYTNGYANSLIQAIFLSSVVLFLERHTNLIFNQNQTISE